MSLMQETAASLNWPGRTHWLHTARELADDLATDAVARERDARTPHDEIGRLRESGLLTLLVPLGSGGQGADRSTAYEVVRALASADPAVAHLLARHYTLSAGVRFFANSYVADRVERESAEANWFWGGSLAPEGSTLTLRSSSGGYRLQGRLTDVPAAGVADRLLLRAAREGTGEPLAVLVDPALPGITATPAQESFGQRLSPGRTLEFTEVELSAGDVHGSLSADDGVLSPFAALAAPAARLGAAHFCLGLAEGLLGEAREHRRAAQAGWPSEGHRWTGPPGTDPCVLGTVGSLTVGVQAASALTAQAVETLERALAQGEDLDFEEYAHTAALAASAEAAAARAAQEVTDGALDVVGVPGAAARHGLDRFWRDLRVHTLREPVAQRLREVGEYHLDGVHPPFLLPA